MKFIAAILIFFVSFLSAEKSLGEIAEFISRQSTESCKKESCKIPKQTSETHKSCCKSDLCNPFSNCCCFLAPASVENMQPPAYLLISKEKFTSQNERLVLDFKQDCFKPPKIV